jgi:pimeloyl-ACP methyl ester carboxylesterase
VGPRGRSGTALSALLLAICAVSCSYLKWARTQKVERAELKRHPGDLVLEKELAPQDCFALQGSVEAPEELKEPFLVVALDHAGPSHALVGSREVLPSVGAYAILLPSGSYDILFFADLDHNGFFETHEVVGSTPPDAPARVERAQAPDGVIVPGPDITLDLRSPRSCPVAMHLKLVGRPFVVESVDDPIFAPEMGDLGVYKPNQFLARTQSWVYAVGPPDFKKTQVVLVHGIDGTPRDFREIVAKLDRSRYQIWLFFYPSGLGLDQLGLFLARVVAILAKRAEQPDLQLALVAHSMGGLVGRRAVNELCRSGRPPYLKIYVSFDTPYGGIEAVVGAEKRGQALVPSWRDIASDSDFLKRLHEAPLPQDLPFHLFFGWGTSNAHGPRPAGDGTIRLPSQLDPRAQAVATKMTGFGQTHVGILADPDAIAALSRSLEAATSP